MIPNEFAGDTTQEHGPNSCASAAGSRLVSFTEKRAAMGGGSSARALRHAAHSDGPVSLVRELVRGGGAMSTNDGSADGSGSGKDSDGRDVGSWSIYASVRGCDVIDLNCATRCRSY